jgi:hypothetical protein
MRGRNTLFSQSGSRKRKSRSHSVSPSGIKQVSKVRDHRLIKYNMKKGGLFGSPQKILHYSGVLMAGSSRTTFAKRQKERQRQEKQAEKAQRKLQRKTQDPETDPNAPEKPKDLTVTYNEEGIPEGFGFHDF